MEAYFFSSWILSKCHVRTAIRDWSEVWCLQGNGMGILRRTDTPMVRAMCGVGHIDRVAVDLVCMLGLNVVLVQLSRANNVCLCEYVL